MYIYIYIYIMASVLDQTKSLLNTTNGHLLNFTDIYFDT